MNIIGRGKRLAFAPAFIVVVAFAVRLAILFVVSRRAVPTFSELYPIEIGCIAKSIASGKGFSSPLPFLKTGPTAWHAPVYPYILGGIFWIWGPYSVAARIASQVANCLFAALAAFPIFGVAEHCFGRRAGVISSWLWVVLPSAWHIPLAEGGYATVSMLLVTLIFWQTLDLEKRNSTWQWVALGALWAAEAMTNPSLLVIMPFLLVWIVRRLRKRILPWRGHVTAAVMVFVLGAAPWTVRNYRAFGKFVPMRSVLGIALWMGNNPVAEGVQSFPMLPALNLSEAMRFQRMGEISYSRFKGREALAFIRAHPEATLLRVAHNAASFWLSVSDRPDEGWSADPAYIKMLLLLNVLMLLMVALGISSARRVRSPYLAPFMWALLTFPVLYYITYPLVRFRFPIEPLLIILAAYGLVELSTRSAHLLPFQRLSGLRNARGSAVGSTR